MSQPDYNLSQMLVTITANETDNPARRLPHQSFPASDDNVVGKLTLPERIQFYFVVAAYWLWGQSLVMLMSLRNGPESVGGAVTIDQQEAYWRLKRITLANHCMMSDAKETARGALHQMIRANLMANGQTNGQYTVRNDGSIVTMTEKIKDQMKGCSSREKEYLEVSLEYWDGPAYGHPIPAEHEPVSEDRYLYMLSSGPTRPQDLPILGAVG